MVRLGRSPACSTRNRARLLAFRNKESSGKKDESSEAIEVKQYWSTLSVDEKLKCVRFEDRKLVDELYEIQQSLYSADLECFVHGFHLQEKVRSKAGIQFFDVEGILDGNGNLSPKAFIAHRAFVEMDSMFDFVEERLQRPFLQDAPHLEQQDWLSLLKPRPTSWLEFVRVALRLVELSLRRAWQATLIADDSCAADAPCAPDAVDTSEAVASQSHSAKRKARKKRTMLAHAAASEESVNVAAAASSAEVTETMVREECLGSSASASSSGCPATSAIVHEPEQHHISAEDLPTTADSEALEEEIELSACKGTVCSTEPESLLTTTSGDDSACIADAVDAEYALPVSQPPRQSAKEACASSPRQTSAILANDMDTSHMSVSEGCRSRATTDSFDTMPVLSASQSLRQSAREARICAVVAPALIASQASRASAREAWVRAEIQMREDRGRSRHAAPWVLANGDSGENWVDGFRAIVKNTFLDIEEMEPESCALRAHSWPVSSGRYGGA